MSTHSRTNESADFPTTLWTLVRAAQGPRDEGYQAAMNRLITAYWKPVFYFLRARGDPLHRAEDLTQEFFSRIHERGWSGQADPSEGRFRSFLLRILRDFRADQRPGRLRRQKVFEQQLVPIGSLIGDEDRSYEPAAGETPERVFMRRWARSVLDSVFQRLRGFYERQRRLTWYEMFVARHDLVPGRGRESQEELGARYGLTRDRVRYALAMAEKRFAHYLRDEVREQVSTEAEIEDEVGELLGLLGR